jgi:hypothetical protein
VKQEWKCWECGGKAREKCVGYGIASRKIGKRYERETLGDIRGWRKGGAGGAWAARG